MQNLEELLAFFQTIMPQKKKREPTTTLRKALDLIKSLREGDHQ
jgi:hypothetical protein